MFYKVNYLLIIVEEDIIFFNYSFITKPDEIKHKENDVGIIVRSQGEIIKKTSK